jgi:hypothetical protein
MAFTINFSGILHGSGPDMSLQVASGATLAGRGRNQASCQRWSIRKRRYHPAAQQCQDELCACKYWTTGVLNRTGIVDRDIPLRGREGSRPGAVRLPHVVPGPAASVALQLTGGTPERRLNQRVLRAPWDARRRGRFCSAVRHERNGMATGWPGTPDLVPTKEGDQVDQKPWRAAVIVARASTADA